MIVNTHIKSDILHIKVIGTDEGKSPVLLLQFLDKILDHLQTVLLEKKKEEEKLSMLFYFFQKSFA